MEGKLPEREETEVSPATVLPGKSEGETLGVLPWGFQSLVSGALNTCLTDEHKQTLFLMM